MKTRTIISRFLLPGALLALLIAGWALAAAQRPRLAILDYAKRLNEAKQNTGFTESPRVAIARMRELFLDHPEANTSGVRLNMIRGMALLPETSFTFVAGEMEQAALEILSRVKAGSVPHEADFRKAGFVTYAGYSDWRLDWSKACFIEDIDGDNSPEVVIAWPTYERGVVSLFRREAGGWRAYRLLTGSEIRGLWIVNIAKQGPRVILIASLTDNEYDPNLLMDAFVWRNGRIENVLAAKIPHGFQFDRRDLDGDGVQEIRLFGGEKQPEYGEKARQSDIYRWDGQRYNLHKTERVFQQRDGYEWLAQGLQKLEAGDLTAATMLLRQAAEWREPGPYGRFDYGERQTARFYLGVCQVILGDMKNAKQTLSMLPNLQDSSLSALARRFAGMGTGAQDRLSGLAALGQVFRALDITARVSVANRAAKDILTDAGLTPENYREADLTGDGTPEGIAQIRWNGGSGVVALQRNTGGAGWNLHILAYGVTQEPPKEHIENYDARGFYMPHAPALQIYPAASSVGLDSVGSGASPSIRLTYVQSGRSAQAVVRWNGERFVCLQPVPMVRENLDLVLNRIEAQLFEQRGYRQTLRALEAFDRRVHASRLTDLDKSRLLLESAYHQALCYRKLGDAPHAAALYDALTRAEPGGTENWGQLARQWIVP